MIFFIRDIFELDNKIRWKCLNLWEILNIFVEIVFNDINCEWSWGFCFKFKEWDELVCRDIGNFKKGLKNFCVVNNVWRRFDKWKY